MPRNVLEFRVVVASPSDLFEMRKAVFDVIDELNRAFEIQKVAIRGLGWEEYVTPGIGSSAQDVVNKQLLVEYDILVAMFATKLGTPTPNAASGTIEEIDNAIANVASPMGKHRVQVYFRDKLDGISNISVDEFKGLFEFRECLKSRGILFGLFKDRDDLQREIRINIQKPILEFLGRRDGSSDHGEDNSSQAPPSAVATDDMAGQRSDEEELGNPRLSGDGRISHLAATPLVLSREWQPC